ncbi:hypothetical protein DFQ27_004720 [Actinomortierella ambigua]|uniref:Cation-transporting P-type ATPase N-terminal domain-containing protein n=1 Tax=Actinomortierella ambigua TaxID=1343610 RepID=A0A9P6UCE2_9FUNG|nr:hypothetical protein DFQ27_004720 [Actinomortierella ambigua]
MFKKKKQQDPLSLVRTRTLERAQGNAIPIEYRTLSIHVTETHQSRATAASHRKLGVKEKDEGKKLSIKESEEADYFASLDFHTLDVSKLDLRFNTNNETGLLTTEAERRLKTHGPNTLKTQRPNYLKRGIGYLFGGFCSILWVGAITFFLCWQPPLSDPPNDTNLALALLVIFVILLQASFSAFQDFSTAKVMKSILDMIPAECVVCRDGQMIKIPASQLVVGDRVHLSMGNKVPADMRLTSVSSDARFDRAVLTGESEPIEAATEATDENFLETRNVAFMGTLLVQGSCSGVVVLKGNDTLMGRINRLTTNRKEKKTIIQREINRFVYIIISLTIFLISIIVIFWAAYLRRQYPEFMSTAVMLVTIMGCVIAFIPEALPVCISLTLLVVAKRMKANDILPKALSTVETLGCVNVICSDKTGTLTENKMVVTSQAFLDSESTPEEAAATLSKESKPDQLPTPNDHPSLLAIRQLQLAARLCNNAKFDTATKSKPLAERGVIGDATDSALLRYSEAIGATGLLAEGFNRTYDIPFNSKNKWMMTVHEGTAQQPQLIKTIFGSHYSVATADSTNEKRSQLVLVKGAPDVLVPHCSHYLSYSNNTTMPLSPEWIEKLGRIQQAWSRRGQRVLMLCRGTYHARPEKEWNGVSSSAIQEDLTFHGLRDLCILGLVGIMDPPRVEIKDTIAACRRAGSRFFMVTGDFSLTAAAIAQQIGLFRESGREPHTYEHLMNPELCDFSAKPLPAYEVGRPQYREDTSLVLTGGDLVKMSPGEWDMACQYEEIVFARTSPEQKLRIVYELQQRECVVAMTGDGVNDAPSLKAADVGVAVVTGSDVAIEAADLILLGGFDSIPAAIRLGRLAFQNLQKVTGYLLPAGSYSEVTPVLVNVFFGTPLPLSSFLMLIICCFTDGFPCMALVFEREEFDLMSMPPRNAKLDHLITPKIYLQSYGFIGNMMTFFSLMNFFLYLKEHTGIGFSDVVFSFGNIPYEKSGITPEEFIMHVNTGNCVTFVTLVICQWWNVLSVRSRRMSILQSDPITNPARRNPWLFVGMVFACLMAILVTETPAIQKLMLTGSVPIKYWLLPFPMGFSILVLDEIRKLMVRSSPKSIFAKLAW